MWIKLKNDLEKEYEQLYTKQSMIVLGLNVAISKMKTLETDLFQQSLEEAGYF